MSFIILPPVSPDFGIDLEDMIDEVKGTLRNEKIVDEITGWINMEITYLASCYTFPTYHAESGFTTQLNLRQYPLESNFLWMKTIVHPNDNRRLAPINEAILSTLDAKYKTLTGPITHYDLHATAVNLYKVPDGAHTIQYSYQRRPLKLISFTDVCDLPPEWHPLVTLGAAKRGMRREGRFDEIAEIQLDIDRMKKDLKHSVYKRPDTNYGFSGPELIGMGRDWPVLPSSYPRKW